MVENNGWNAWARQITDEIERIVRGIDSNHVDIVEIKQQLTRLQETVNMVLVECESIPAMKLDIARLQIKAGVWGLLAGAIPVVIVILFQLFK